MQTTTGVLIAIVAIAALGSGCHSIDARTSSRRLELELQSTLNAFIATNPSIAGVALSVDMPRSKLLWSGAAGVADRVTGAALNPGQPVRIASNTKTYVAAAVLCLQEQGRVQLDDPIARYLAPESVAALTEGGYDPQLITIRHLLTHTSGLFDFGDSVEYNKQYMENPRRRWTREEQVTFAMNDGRPYGAPGRVFAYSDTGYILLGEILERSTGMPMGAALRDLLGYKRLGLNSTWLESFEPNPQGSLDRAHQYEGERDTYSDDPSYDLYGGGGLVASTRDLAAFMRAIFIGRIYSQATTLDTMLSTVPGTIPGPPMYGFPQKPEEYRMGIFVRKVDGMTVYSHTGYWGTLAAYVPDLDLAVGMYVTQQKAREQRGALFRSVLRLLRSAQVAG